MCSQQQHILSDTKIHSKRYNVIQLKTFISTEIQKCFIDNPDFRAVRNNCK